MANRMIIDASHPEETRVVVLRGNRVEEFDFESASKRPLRGNIYLAKVTRVEPSLQAAFVDYGGNRHGFLAFSEIHPDYYQIPVADRQALLEEEALSQRDDDEEPNGERRSRRHRRPRRGEAELRAAEVDAVSEPSSEDRLADEDEPPFSQAVEEPPASPTPEPSLASPEAEPTLLGEAHEAPSLFAEPAEEAKAAEVSLPAEPATLEGRAAPSAAPATPDEEERESEEEPAGERRAPAETAAEAAFEAGKGEEPSEDPSSEDDDEPEVTTLEGGAEETHARARKPGAEEDGEPVEQIGGDALEEVPRRPQRLRRQYKIQEVIKRRQVLLVQVVKEERGNKGAALTTYLSLAGRYSVLMPNTARGGGISRKITDAQDRNRLKSIAEELDVPEGMGVILRTAGATRTKAEVKRDFEYLLRMWETVRETTLASSAPTLVYEEGSLIKRAIRDLYSKDVEEIVVAGETAYREARQFMRLLMPSHVNCVHLYRDTMPVFAKAGVEAQLDAMFSNQVTLKSGGYIVINQTEALVAIDVNSGRSTREHNIEDTALRTNLEAADEIARQLRLRDLAGLIVVDFIDMEESRNNRAVERRIKDALKNDRARIQVGRISHFGLLEMSRQRIRTGVLEGSTVICPHCQGAGVVRSTASIALHVLRVLEDALIKSSSHDVAVRTRTPVALYILNQKRANLRDLERRFGVAVTVEADDSLTGSNYHAIERGEPATGVKAEAEAPPPPSDEFATIEPEPVPPEEEREDAFEAPGEEGSAEQAQGERMRPASTEESEAGRHRRRRRRRRGGDRAFGESLPADAPQPTDAGLAVVAEIGGDLMPAGRAEGRERRGHDDGDRGRRRRQRGGRRPLPSEMDRLPATGGDFGEGELPSAEAGLGGGFTGESFEARSDAPEAAVAERIAPVREDRPREGAEQETEAPALERRSPPGGDLGPDLAAPRRAEAAPSAESGRVEPAPAAEPSRAESSPTGREEPAAVEPAPAEPGPPRPRRTGWWQRARASIVGD